MNRKEAGLDLRQTHRDIVKGQAGKLKRLRRCDGDGDPAADAARRCVMQTSVRKEMVLLDERLVESEPSAIPGVEQEVSGNSIDGRKHVRVLTVGFKG